MWQIAIYALVVLWVFPGSLWRPVALAILVQWGIAEGAYAVFGDHISLPVYIVGDCAIIATVWLWRSHWSDWIIIALYPFVWYLYTLPETRDQWVSLYWVAVAQMIVAGPWPQLIKALGSYHHGPKRRTVRGAL